MKKSDELWKKISPSTHVNRDILIDYVKAVAEEARLIPLYELSQKGQQSPPRHFPETPGEDIANKINYALVMQDWINHETADDLEEIIEISGELEIHTDNQKLWEELFYKIDNLA